MPECCQCQEELATTKERLASMLARVETLERQLAQHCQTGHRQHQQNADSERTPPLGWYA